MDTYRSLSAALRFSVYLVLLFSSIPNAACSGGSNHNPGNGHSQTLTPASGRRSVTVVEYRYKGDGTAALLSADPFGTIWVARDLIRGASQLSPLISSKNISAVRLP